MSARFCPKCGAVNTPCFCGVPAVPVAEGTACVVVALRNRILADEPGACVDGVALADAIEHQRASLERYPARALEEIRAAVLGYWRPRGTIGEPGGASPAPLHRPTRQGDRTMPAEFTTPPLEVHHFGPLVRGRGRRQQTHGMFARFEVDGLIVGRWQVRSAADVAALGIDMERIPDTRHLRRQMRDPWPSHHVGTLPGGEAAEAIFQRLWGRSGADCVASALRRQSYLLWPPPEWSSRKVRRYLVPAKETHSFERSRRRSKWIAIAPLREGSWLARYVDNHVAAEQPEDPWSRLQLEIPAPASIPAGVYVCDTCGKRGPRTAFRERILAGLAGSVGLDCPDCPKRDIGAMALAFGSPRGAVAPAPEAEQPCILWA